MLTWKEALWFSCGLCWYGLIGIGGALAYWVGKFLMSTAHLNSESTVFGSWTDEALMSSQVPLCTPDYNTAGVRLRVYVGEVIFGPMNLLTGFFHLSTFCYLVPARLRAIMLATYVLTHALCLYFFVVVGFQGTLTFLPAISVLALVVVVKLVLPRGEMVSSQLARCAFVAAIGSGMSSQRASKRCARVA